MEKIFLDTVNFISTYRVWIMPAALAIVVAALMYQAYQFFSEGQ